MKETFRPVPVPKFNSCPFCGFKELTIHGVLSPFDIQMLYFVVCNRCKGRGPETYRRDEAVLTWSMRYASFLNATIEGAESHSGHNRDLVTPKTGDLKP